MCLSLLLLWAGNAEVEASTSRPAALPASRSAVADEAEVRRVIRELAHPVPGRRRAAVRQLAEWGPLSLEPLDKAARDPSLEVALQARDLLAQLRSAALLGARVRIGVDRDRIDWDEPLTLIVIVENPMGVSIRLPWASPGDRSTSRPAADDPAQVAAMMDVADFLVVSGPDGRRVDFRVDPIEQDAAVQAAVELRARQKAPTSSLDAGRATQVRMPAFNCGWARFPLLAPGKYRITLVSQPQWRDTSWVEEGLGRVQSNTIAVDVLRGAPEAVRNSTRPHRLLLSKADDQLVVEMESMWDRPQWISLDFGGDPTVQAKLEWRITPTAWAGGDPIVLHPPAGVLEIHPERIQRLDPGARLMIAKVPVGDVFGKMKSLGVARPGRYDILARYVHLVTAERLRQDLALRRQTGDIPRQLFTGTATSNSITTRLDGGN